MGLFGTAKTILVVDVAAVLKTKGVRGQAAPRQQLQILRALSRVVEREKFGVTAVLIGKPLDKAQHNKLFDGVRVRYAKTADGLNKELLRALKQAGAPGVLVSEDPALEKRAMNAGNRSLRVSTFRKLLDDGHDQAEGGGSSNRPPRNRRDRGPRPGRGGKQKSQQPKQRPAADAGASDSNDTISQMIDLVE